MTISLRHPTAADEAKLFSYKAAFLVMGDSMDGTSGLQDTATFTEWFANWNSNLREETVRPGLVSSTTFLAVDEQDNLVGMIDLRHRLNEYLLQFGGNIGYSVLPAARGQGVATKMLALALAECRARQMERVLITCDKENIASAKTILHNGGVLENEVSKDGGITQRYWIMLSTEV